MDMDSIAPATVVMIDLNSAHLARYSLLARYF